LTYVSKYIKLDNLELCTDNLLVGYVTKDPTVWLDEAIPPTKYAIAQTDKTIGELPYFIVTEYTQFTWQIN
jgi:hypothetical protein